MVIDQQWIGEVVLLLLVMLGLIIGLLGWGICALVELRIKVDVIEGQTRHCWRDPRCQKLPITAHAEHEKREGR